MPKVVKNKILLAALIAAACIIITVAQGFACNDGCAGGDGCVATPTWSFPSSSISADTLRNLMKSGVTLTLLECRTSSQTRNISIPGARIVREGDDETQILSQVMATDSMIIIYPGFEGGNMASVTEILRNNGFRSIIEYPPGIHGWLTYGYETSGELP